MRVACSRPGFALMSSHKHGQSGLQASENPEAQVQATPLGCPSRLRAGLRLERIAHAEPFAAFGRGMEGEARRRAPGNVVALSAHSRFWREHRPKDRVDSSSRSPAGMACQWEACIVCLERSPFMNVSHFEAFATQ